MCTHFTVPDDWVCGFKPFKNVRSTGGSLFSNASDFESCYEECERRRGRCHGFDWRQSSMCYLLNYGEHNQTTPSGGDEHFEFMCQCTEGNYLL